MAQNEQLYDELTNAISEVIDNTNESEEFKRRFKKLIENAFDKNCSNEDIAAVLELIYVNEDGVSE